MTAHAMIVQLLLQIPQRFPGARVWRRQVQAGFTQDGRFLRAGVPGEPDVEGIFPITGCHGETFGVFLGVEVKAPGDRLSKKQRNFGLMLLRAGGIWLECRDVESVMAALERHRDDHFQANRDALGRFNIKNTS